jgi:hypothetical protein
MKTLNELLILSPVLIFLTRQIFVLRKTPKPLPSSKGSLFRCYYVAAENLVFFWTKIKAPEDPSVPE